MKGKIYNKQRFIFKLFFKTTKFSNKRTLLETKEENEKERKKIKD